MKREKDIKKFVKDGYGKIAKNFIGCCGSTKSCCSKEDQGILISKKIGYSEEELKIAPQGSNLGLGCGNPLAFVNLKEGDFVLDLGSGAGFDSFLASKKVGVGGKVFGIDMTKEMVERARENAKKGGFENVEFKLGEIENLPFEDNFFDLIISNCVINLSPEKEKVFKEAYRVLKKGGRLVVSDMVLLKDLPEFVKKSKEAYISCISGAVKKDEYIKIIKDAGFKNVEILEEKDFSLDCIISDPNIKNLKEYEKEIKILSIKVSAYKK